MMVQRLVILLLVLMVVFVGCGEDEPEKVKRIIWTEDGAEMVLIPAETFVMGDHFASIFDALPMHTVELDDFYMDIHEVTVLKFKEFVKETGYEYDLWDDVAKYSPTGKHPMIWVTWDDATAYAKWVGKRLPTEAEWEFAARGGLLGKKFSWGDDKAVASEYAHFGSWKEGKGTTKPVASFKPNGYGLYDMAGNVWEWCADWYGEDYYSNSSLRNPQGPSTGEWRVLRGGSWYVSLNSLRVAYRVNSLPLLTSLNYGFRCVSGFPAAQ